MNERLDVTASVVVAVSETDAEYVKFPATESVAVADSETLAA
jgi:hypothetical protein